MEEFIDWPLLLLVIKSRVEKNHLSLTDHHHKVYQNIILRSLYKLQRNFWLCFMSTCYFISFICLPFVLFFFPPFFVNHLESVTTLPWPNTQAHGVGITSAPHDPAEVTTTLCSGTSASRHCCGWGFGQTGFQILFWNKPMNDSVFWHAWSTLGGCTLLAKAEVWSIL